MNKKSIDKHISNLLYPLAAVLTAWVVIQFAGLFVKFMRYEDRTVNITPVNALHKYSYDEVIEENDFVYGKDEHHSW